MLFASDSEVAVNRKKTCVDLSTKKVMKLCRVLQIRLKSNKFNVNSLLRSSVKQMSFMVRRTLCGPMWIHAKIKNLCRVLQIRLKSNKFNAKFSPPQLRRSKTNVIHAAQQCCAEAADRDQNM